MQQGIGNIGGFLAASKELRVLWSAPYLSRLWCIFELSAYKKVNPAGKITFAPLFIESIILQIFIWVHIVTSVFWYALIVAKMWLLAILILVGLGGVPLVHSLRCSYRSKNALIAALDSFDVWKVECQNDFDRARIHAAIVRWYGSLDAFSAHVRGPLRQDVLLSS